jgi:transposase-like protein
MQAAQVQLSPPNERQCAALLRRVRWPDGPACPYCFSIVVIRSGRHLGVYQRYRCKSCARIFNDKTGTIFEDSRLPLRVWFSVALLQRRMSIRQVSKTLGMYYYTTHRMVAKLRRSAYPDLITSRLQADTLRETRATIPEEAGLPLRQVLRVRKTAALS